MHVDGVLACDDVIDARSLLVTLLGHGGTLTTETHTSRIKKEQNAFCSFLKKGRPLILS